MKIGHGLSVAAILWLCAVSGSTMTPAQEPVPQPGVDPQLRGPVHEAFAVPVGLDPKPLPIVPQQPPNPVPESPPDQKPQGNQVVWISGYWGWDEDTAQYLWVSGFWRDVPPGKRWVPGHWSQVQGGWQYTRGFWADQAQAQIAYVPPPPPSLEKGPTVPEPALDQFYVPGCWVYVERQYRWRPGYWLAQRANWIFTPAHYVWTPAGCIFVEGHWDYELARRGLLFCPVRLALDVIARPAFRFIPRLVLAVDALVDALFVDLTFHRFCFGDYFGPSYVSHGFIPWVDYHLPGNIADPFFHQFAIVHRGEANWARDFRKTYDDRRLNLALRPPRTLAEQERYRRELAEHRAITANGRTFQFTNAAVAERRFTMGMAISKVDARTMSLHAVTAAERANAAKTIEHHAALNVERKENERKFVAEKPAFRPSDVRREAKISPVPEHLRTPEMVFHPAAPVVPAHVERPVPMYEPPRPERVSREPLRHEK